MLKAGRELDALIAEKVLGDKLEMCPIHHSLSCCGRNLPHYSTQIADAWLVVEKLQRYVKLEQDNAPLGSTTGVTWQVTFALGHYAEADTAPLAICLAALRAVGVQEGCKDKG